MKKYNWVIDANILGNICRNNVDNKATRDFLTQVKDHHTVSYNRDVLDEYKPMPKRRNLSCDDACIEFLRVWITQLVNKFGKKVNDTNLPATPECLTRLGDRFKKDDVVYVRLALFNHDRLLVATETHFQNAKSCIEGDKYNIKMFYEKEAMDFINGKS